MSVAVKQVPVAWRPQHGPQSDACAAADICQELFYGGAVFGGKSDFLPVSYTHLTLPTIYSV